MSATNHSLASFLSLQFVFLLIFLELVISIQMMIQRLLHSNRCWFIQDFSRIEDRLHNLDKRSAPPKTASASSLLKHQILSLPSPMDGGGGAGGWRNHWRELVMSGLYVQTCQVRNGITRCARSYLSGRSDQMYDYEVTCAVTLLRVVIENLFYFKPKRFQISFYSLLFFLTLFR